MPVPASTRPPRSRATKARILDAALVSFGTRGFDGTSLDAVAAETGVVKQTLLYHFSSKDDLFDAVIDAAGAELVGALEDALAQADEGWARIEAVVVATFRLALRRPELLGLLREVSRPGSAAAPRLVARLEPLVERARQFLEAEMAEGRMRPCDSRLVLLSAYSTVMGVATEVEVLRAVGVEPTLRSAVIRRRELLRFLRAALL